MAIWTSATDAMATLAQQVATLSTEAHFPELGSDCVLHVLRYLPLYDALQLATVSSDWKSAANSRLAEQKILNLSYASGSVDSSLVSWLLGRMPRVCCLVLNDCVDVTLSAVSGTVFSLMARLDSRGPWASFLIPAFIYFFQNYQRNHHFYKRGRINHLVHTVVKQYTT